MLRHHPILLLLTLLLALDDIDTPEDHDFFSLQRFVSVRFRYRNGDVDGRDDFENQPFPVQCTCGC